MRNRQSGQTLIQALVGMAVMGIVALSVMQLTKTMGDTANYAKVGAIVQDLRDKHLRYIDNNIAWQNTIAKNISMRCLKNGTPCNETAPLAFTLYDNGATPQPVFTVSAGQEFFTNRGGPCTKKLYDDPKDTNCIFRASIGWQAICPGPAVACTNPYVRVAGGFELHPKSQIANFNANNYTFVVPKASAANTTASAQSICQSMQGTWDGTTCNLLNVNVASNPSNPGSSNSSTGTATSSGGGTSTGTLSGTLTTTVTATGSASSTSTITVTSSSTGSGTGTHTATATTTTSNTNTQSSAATSTNTSTATASATDTYASTVVYTDTATGTLPSYCYNPPTSPPECCYIHAKQPGTESWAYWNVNAGTCNVTDVQKLQAMPVIDTKVVAPNMCSPYGVTLQSLQCIDMGDPNISGPCC